MRIVARYLNSKPVLERMKNRELIEVILHRIISLDPSFNYSGAYRIFGSFYTRIPGIELSQSKNFTKNDGVLTRSLSQMKQWKALLTENDDSTDDSKSDRSPSL